MQFWLGTHQPDWLAKANVPLMVTVRRLKDRRRFPRARAPWWQDSNGFSELSLHGHYQTTAADYVAQTRRHRDEVGMLAYASPQDWMCEPAVRQQTGLSVAEHQRRTIDSLLELRAREPTIPWLPVLQGWDLEEYCGHIAQYHAAGINLRAEPLVGIGTVCRRQSTDEGVAIMRLVDAAGIKAHGFGVKLNGLRRGRAYLTSADSLAWSYDARRSPRPCPAGGTHQNCANCLWYALRWRAVVLRSTGRPAVGGTQLGFGL